MSDLRELLSKIDIVDVIGSYISLKRSGNNYIARCPFHPDDTPSLSVSPSKGIWKCFGCGVGGDAVKFVSMYENISYTEALLKLARRYNIPIRLEGKKKDKAVLYALEEVARFYHENLKKDQRAIYYLKDRGLSSKDMQRFMLGYSPSSEELVRFLKEKDMLTLYERTGNLQKVSENTYRDIFLHRIIIPIRDAQGNVIAFGGRSIDGAHPKYLNSPESEVFKKGHTLFGLYEAKDHIREKGYAVVVEGYFDVISLHAVGVRNAVAPLGTALTGEHAKELSRYTREVVLLFDGDSAGKRAIRSALPHLLSEGFTVRVVYLPEGQDPDGMAREDKELLISLIVNAKDFFDTAFQQLSSIKSEAFRDAMNLLGCLKDRIKQESLLQAMSMRLGVAVSLLRDYLPKDKKENRVQGRGHLSYAEKVVLKAMLEKGVNTIPIDRIVLSPYAMQLYQAIKEGEVSSIPEEVLRLKLEDLEGALEGALESLSVDRMMEESPTRRLRRSRFA